jgi:uncharacterized pyridoxamine 5'-phosphate oxidase family protein
MGLVERLLGKPAEVRATPISDALSLLGAEEKGKSDARLTGMRSSVEKLSLKDWKQPLPGEASIYILIAENNKATLKNLPQNEQMALINQNKSVNFLKLKKFSHILFWVPGRATSNLGQNMRKYPQLERLQHWDTAPWGVSPVRLGHSIFLLVNWG